jgi:hypothetical protein
LTYSRMRHHCLKAVEELEKKRNRCWVNWFNKFKTIWYGKDLKIN